MLGRMISLLAAIATSALIVVAQAAPSPDAATSSSTDPATIAQAYGDVSVFILDVAAGNDGTPRDPAAEGAFASVFADQLLQSYPGLDPQAQRAFAQLPQLDTSLRQAWATLPTDQRLAVRDQWAEAFQANLASVPCDAFDALARAYLLPTESQYMKVNSDRLVQCWNDHPELARSRDGRDLAAERAQNNQAASGGDHAAFVGLMNAETTRHAGTLNMLSIMSGDPYRWSVK